MDQPPIEKENTLQEFPSHWLEGIINQIVARNPEQVNLSTGKTPSGHIHMGILREILICDAIARILKQRGKKVMFRLFIDSLDAAKRFPKYITQDYQKKYLGKPFALIPDPLKNSSDSYAEVFGKELIKTFEKLGISVNPVWTHDVYKTSGMKNLIRIGLRKNEEVKAIVARFLTASMNDEQKAQYLDQQKEWMGAMVICENCQRTQQKLADGTVKPNRVLDYLEDTDECYYECPACGYKGKVTIESGLIKLNWRLDWPAKWTLFQATCEPAGKDHCTPGGSYDTGLELCKKIYGYEGPIKVAYEWLRLGDKDMKTSKGIVFTPEKFLDFAEPEIIRMLIYQTNPNKHISFRIEELEQYYNEFYRIERIYYNLENPASEEELREIKFIYPLICSKQVPQDAPIRFPFKLLTVLAQLEPMLKQEGIIKRAIEYLKNEGHSGALDRDSFIQRIKLAKNWTEEMKLVLANEKNPAVFKKISRKVVLFSIIPELLDDIKNQLIPIQIRALEEFLNLIKKEPKLTNENIRELMMDVRTKVEISANKLFQALYLVLLGKRKGPRLGPLMEMLDKNWIANRLEAAISK